MRVAAILLVCAFVHGKNVELNKNGCPIDYSIEKLYAHEDCNKYYQCTHGNLVERICFMELLFNVDTQECDWPHDVDCGNRVIPDGNEVDNNGNGGGSGNGDNGSGNGNNDNGNGNNGNDGSCNCNCNCPSPDENENENGNENDGSDGGDSGDGDCDNGNGGGGNGDGDNGNGNGDGSEGGGNDGSCNCNPGEAPSICSRPGSEGDLVAHEKCNKFYKCAHGVPVALKCPGVLLYNPYKRECDYPEKVDCEDRIIPDPDENDNGDGDENDNGNGDGGNGNGDGDNGNGNGDGSEDGGNDGSCNCNPGEAPSICGRPGSEGDLVAHEKCNKFYKCAHGVPVALKCPGVLLYNPFKKECDYPEKVNCEDRIIPDPDENDNGDGDENDNGNGDGGNGNGDGDNGDGNGDGSEDGGNDGSCNCNPGEAPSICGRPGSEGDLVAHEKCNKFYKCAHGVPVALKCPGVLLYNPFKKECDYPEKVNCEDRIIPDPDENDNGDGDENDNGNGDGGNGNGDGDNGDGNGDGSEDGGNDGSCNCNPGEAPSICGRPGSEGDLVAHEKCNKFYKCAHGVPVALKCPGVLLYNPFKKECDYPEKVNCEDRIIPDPDENDNGDGDENDNGNGDGGNGNGDGDNGDGNGDGSEDGGNDGSCNCNPGEAPSICGRPGSEGDLVAHEKCNKFYKCAHGVPVALECPGVLLYNPYKRECDYPEKVDCEDRIIPDPNENDGGSGSENNNSNEDDGNDNGNSNENDNNGNGDGNENSSCEDSNVDENNNNNNNNSCNCNPQEANPICRRVGSDGIHIAHEYCTKYYRCINGIAVSQPCPKGTHYNPYINVCDWPSNVDCADRIIPDPDDESDEEDDSDKDKDIIICNCDPEEAPLICARNNSNNILVANEKCNHYYVCDNGRPIAKVCPENTLYNPHKEVCDWPANVECGDRVIPDPKEVEEGDIDENENPSEIDNNRPCNCDPDQAEAICAAKDSESVLIAHEKCNKYYICNFGLPVVQKCQNNLLYNPYREVCDWSANVECGDRLIPEPEDTDEGSCNCSPRQAPSICAHENSNGVAIAHENCHQYYKCLNNKPIVLSCHSSWLFNPYKQKCESPENVNCGHRLRINNDN